MSTQSGITAASELLNAFKELDGDALVIRVTEDKTQLVPDHAFPQSRDSDLPNTFKKLNEYFSKTYPQPAYIIISESNGNFIFISFVPDVAPIREKMLYASSKNSCMVSLGSSNFPQNLTFAWTDLDELSYDHYKASISDFKSNVLTSEEKLLSEMNSLQAMTIAESKGNQRFQKELVSLSAKDKLLFDFDENLAAELNSIIKDNNFNRKLITFHIDSTKELIKLSSSSENIETSSLLTALSSGFSTPKPQYSLYNYSLGKFVFIYSCPSGSKVKDRMTYASLKQGLINHLKDLFKDSELSINKSIEVGDLDELDITQLEHSEISKNFTSESRKGLKFTKPKGPRRK